MANSAFELLSPEEKQRDFQEKDFILQESFEQIAPLSFYTDYVFHDMDDVFTPSVIMYNYTEREDGHNWKRQTLEFDEFYKYFDRDDIAINPCGYWNNYPRRKLLRRVYAFVMDVDGVRPQTLTFLLNRVDRGEFPKPTAITNSGSGIHFFYILDEALQVGYKEKFYENLKLAWDIYFRLHAKMKEFYKDVQKHHLGQDYRLVGSLTKFGDVSTAWKTGDFWQIEDLAKAIGVTNQDVYKPRGKASSKMVTYAKSISKTLELPMPDVSSPEDVFTFIAENKDEAYHARQEKRKYKVSKKKSLGGWYQSTWNAVYTKTEAGNRFNAMRGLAIVAYKCGIAEEQFETDLEQLSTLWQIENWKGCDEFNPDNLEAIIRLFRNGERYKNTSRERLEELFGWKWKGSKRRINGRSQSDHLKRARAIQTVDYPNGEWRNKNGRPTAEQTVRAWRETHPDGRKCDCIRETGLSKPTVYHWWNEKGE